MSFPICYKIDEQISGYLSEYLIHSMICVNYIFLVNLFLIEFNNKKLFCFVVNYITHTLVYLSDCLSIYLSNYLFYLIS